jgi:hypothetical protein
VTWFEVRMFEVPAQSVPLSIWASGYVQIKVSATDQSFDCDNAFLLSQWTKCLRMAELCAQECAYLLKVQHSPTVYAGERKTARIMLKYMLCRAMGRGHTIS